MSLKSNEAMENRVLNDHLLRLVWIAILAPCLYRPDDRAHWWPLLYATHERQTDWK